MSPLRLKIRTAAGVLVDQAVDGIVAEDRSGWFGIRPARADLVASLVPGLLVFRHAQHEGFVALAGGLLDLKGPVCRVMARQAVVANRLEDLAEVLERQLERRRQRASVQRGVLEQLALEALRRLVAGGSR